MISLFRRRHLLSNAINQMSVIGIMNNMWLFLISGVGLAAIAKPQATIKVAKAAGDIVKTSIESVVSSVEPLGIRLNNAGNIEASPSNAWVGEVRPSSHARYAQFAHPVYGVRALARLLDNYGYMYGLRTVRQVITRWAPPSENNTESYIRDVVTRSGVGADTEIHQNFAGVVAAIIHHENGKQPYSKELINEAIRMARG